MRSNTVGFWESEADWPDDAYGFVFLGRALHVVGSALYGDAWTRGEPLTPRLFDLWLEVGGQKYLKSRTSVAASIQNELVKLLKEHSPENVILESEELAPGLQPLTTVHSLSRTTFAPRPSTRISSLVMTAETWLSAAKIAEEENARRNAANERLAGAQDFLKVAMRDGKLRYVLLPLVGGRFSELMPPEWWNRKSPSQIFSECRMDPENPMWANRTNSQHVFVDEIGLRILTTPPDEGFDLPDFGMRDFSDRPVPRPTDFDVMEIEDWSIEMVLAWILWRDPEQVRRFDRDYHKALTVDECMFDTIPAPTLGGLQELLQTDASVDDISFDVALRRLRSALRSGQVIADATNLTSMESRTISPDEWKRLTADTDDGGRTVLVNGLGTPLFGQVLFERRSVIRYWLTQGDEGADYEAPREIPVAAAMPRRSTPSKQRIRDVVEAAGKFFAGSGFLMWTKDEAELELRDLLGAPRNLCRKIFAEPEIAPHFPGEKGPRGTSYENRINELGQFRQFMASANMRK